VEESESKGYERYRSEMAAIQSAKWKAEAYDRAAEEIEKPENRMQGTADGCQKAYADLVRALKGGL